MSVPSPRANPGVSLVAHGSPGQKVFTTEEWRQLQAALSLSDRQLAVLKCVFDDQVGAGMADVLGISEHTVHTHMERLFRRMGVSSRGQLLVKVFAAFLGRSLLGPTNAPPPCQARVARRRGR